MEENDGGKESILDELMREIREVFGVWRYQNKLESAPSLGAHI